MPRPVALLLFLSLLCPAAARAQDLSDNQIWVQALALGRLSENWRSHVEVWPRWFDDASDLGLVIVRAGVGRRITSRLTGWAGYAWIPRMQHPGVRHEQRLWQQLTLALPPAAGWTFSSRLRLEQRWLEPWEGMSNRIRGLGRVQRPFAAGSRWGLAVYDELMITLDETELGPEPGFDRNRLFAGVMRTLSPAATLESGYLWEHSALPDSLSRNEHVLMTTFTLQFPR
jgi:Protein of unknown function (DUF2490)